MLLDHTFVEDVWSTCHEFSDLHQVWELQTQLYLLNQKLEKVKVKNRVIVSDCSDLKLQELLIRALFDAQHYRVNRVTLCLIVYLDSFQSCIQTYLSLFQLKCTIQRWQMNSHQLTTTSNKRKIDFWHLHLDYYTPVCCLYWLDLLFLWLFKHEVFRVAVRSHCVSHFVKGKDLKIVKTKWDFLGFQVQIIHRKNQGVELLAIYH
jgi:hypothetical protein